MDNKNIYNEKDGMNTSRNHSDHTGQHYGHDTQKPCGCTNHQGDNIKNTVKTGLDKGIDKAKEYGSKVKESVTDAAHKVKDVASQTYDNIKEQVRR